MAEYKKDRAYHKHSLAETAMFCYKQLFIPKLTLRDFNVQVGEALANMKVINKVIRFDMPVR
ncbi:hypothetical protein [Candidatus Enterovibrio escicola]|nr:hypothetical protein [Candidatus Enterovibrio escacola]